MKKTLFFVFILMLIASTGNAQFFGGIPQRSDCSNIRAGVCLDKDDGKLYVWNGSAVVLATTAAGAVSAEGGVVLNDSSADVDFRVESNSNEYMLFVDGGNNRIGINESSPDNDIHVTGSVALSPIIKIENIADGATAGQIAFTHSSATPADDDEVGIIAYNANNSSGASVAVNKIYNFIDDVTAGDIGGRMEFYVAMDSNLRSLLSLDGYNGSVNQGTITFNDGSQDVDFIIESDNLAEAFKVQGSDGAVTINGVTALYSDAANLQTFLTTPNAANFETAIGGGAFASDLLGYANAAAVLSGIGGAPLASPTFTGVATLPSESFTIATSAPGSPAIGRRYLASGLTGEWDPLSKTVTTGSVATLAAADADPDTFTTSAQNFLDLGFYAGMTLTVTGDGSNNGTYTIASVTATVITLITGDALTADAEGDSVTLTGHIPYFVRYTPTGSYIGLEDYQGNSITSSIAITGTISGKSVVETDADGKTLDTADLYGSMQMATGAGTWVIPDVDAAAGTGQSFCVYSTTAAAIVINPDDEDKIRLNGTLLAAGDSITSASAAGDFICLMLTDFDSNIAHWTTLGRSGTWTDTN